MTAADRWARRDATRIRNRTLALLERAGDPDPDEYAYLRRHIECVLASPGDLPLGWTSWFAALLGHLDLLERACSKEAAA